MADETPQQAPAPATEGEGAETPAAESPLAKGGPLATYLPLIVAIVVMPLLAWVTLKIKSSGGGGDSGKAAEESVEEDHGEPADDGHGEPADDGHGGDGGLFAPKTDTGPLTVAVPITRDPVTFQRGKPTTENPDDFDKIVILDFKGEAKDLASADKIVVNIANTGGKRFAVARLLVGGRDMGLIKAVNDKRQKLLDQATGALSSKTLEDISRPGFRNILRMELLTLFNQAIFEYGNLIEEVVITEFVIQ